MGAVWIYIDYREVADKLEKIYPYLEKWIGS